MEDLSSFSSTLLQHFCLFIDTILPLIELKLFVVHNETENRGKVGIEGLS